MARDRFIYLKKAFWHPFNLLGLIGFGALWMITGSWGFLALAGGLEALWLYVTVTNPRFQRNVNAQLSKEKQIEAELEREKMVRRLSQRDQARYRELELICRKAHKQLDCVDPLMRPMLEQSLLKLDYLLSSYLRMLTSLVAIGEYTRSTSSEEIEKNIRKLEEELKSDTLSSRIKEVKKSNLDVLNQRLSRIKKAEENRSLFEASLQTLEDTLKLVRDEVLTMQNPSRISSQIDSVIIEMQQNEQLMQEMSKFLGAEDIVEAAQRKMEEGQVR